MNAAEYAGGILVVRMCAPQWLGREQKNSFDYQVTSRNTVAGKSARPQASALRTYVLRGKFTKESGSCQAPGAHYNKNVAGWIT